MMDSPEEKNHSSGDGVGWSALEHSESQAQKKPKYYYCTQADCKNLLSIKHKHKITGNRVCNSCYSLHWRENHVIGLPVTSSSVAASSSNSFIRRSVTRSELPALPNNYSFSTHDWEIIPAIDTARSIAQDWSVLFDSDRAKLFPHAYFEGTIYHSQFSVLTERYKWRDMDRLADRTEAYVRKVCGMLLHNDADDSIIFI